MKEMNVLNYDEEIGEQKGLSFFTNKQIGQVINQDGDIHDSPSIIPAEES